MQTIAQKLKGMNILLTGGTGFFGKNLLLYVRKLNNNFNADIKLTVLSRNPNKFITEFPELIEDVNIFFLKGEIRDFRLAKDEIFDYVIHAATTTAQKNDISEEYSVIVDGTINLLKQIKNKNIKKILYVSSGGVYGEQPPEISHILESYPPNPITQYGKGKLKAEQLCLDSGIPATIARCFTFVGPYLPLDAHFAIGNFILNGLRNEPIVIRGDGKSVRSYMYSEDLAEWLLKILVDGLNGEVYNVGSDKTVSIAVLAGVVNECFDNKLNIKILGKSVVGASTRYVPSILKAQKNLELKLNTKLKIAILNMIDFYRKKVLNL